MLHGFLRYEHAEKERNNVLGTPIEALQISATIAKMLRGNVGVVTEVWSEYVQSGTVASQKPSGNPCGRRGAIVNASQATTKVQEIWIGSVLLQEM